MKKHVMIILGIALLLPFIGALLAEGALTLRVWDFFVMIFSGGWLLVSAITIPYNSSINADAIAYGACVLHLVILISVSMFFWMVA